MDYMELKKQWDEIAGRDMVFENPDWQPHTEFTIIREILRAGGKPQIVVVSVPVAFSEVVSKAIKSLFPQLREYTNLDMFTLTANSILDGYFICDDNLIVKVNRITRHIYTSFYFDSRKYSAAKLKRMLLDKISKISRGRVFRLGNIDDYDLDDFDNGNSSTENAVDTGMTESVNNKTVIPITFDEFCQNYPSQTSNAIQRVCHLLDTICSKPNQGLHFSAVLAGTPGTGKSLFLNFLVERALSRNATVIYGAGLSGSDYLQSLMVFAIKHLPCVVFAFDEGEELGISRDYANTRFINFLIQLLDGYRPIGRASWGLIITTNRPHAMDAAFLRPIRLDEFIEFTAISDPTLSFKVFNFWCDKLGVVLPDDVRSGIKESWFKERTHAECAALAHKIFRMKEFGCTITAEQIKQLLDETSLWTEPEKVRSVRKVRKEKMGFGED